MYRLGAQREVRVLLSPNDLSMGDVDVDEVNAKILDLVVSL